MDNLNDNFDLSRSDTPTPEPETDAYGKIKGAKTDKGADVYAGLSNAHLSFTGIGGMEAISGDIILRGRHGQRDVLFPLEKAVRKYFDWMDMVHMYASRGINGWTEMMDIAQDFKARICEAVEQRKKMQLDVPKEALQFATTMEAAKKPTVTKL